MSDPMDLTEPFDPAEVPDGGMLHGTVGEDEVVVVRVDAELFAIGGSCTHYGGPLNEGVFDGRCVRCPWHHAAFDVRTGRAERGPAVTPVSTYAVTVTDGMATLAAESVDAESDDNGGAAQTAALPDLGRIVVVGGGGAGHAFVYRLIERGHEGPVVMISTEQGVPVDRPNVSKDYLAGSAEPEWMPIHGADVYDSDQITLLRDRQVTKLDLDGGTVELNDGTNEEFDVLVLATGAEPRPLPVDDGTVRYLRTQANADQIAGALPDGGGRAVVIGASFIGLEAASSLRKRGAEVDVIAPEDTVLSGIVGPQLGTRIESEHREAGVRLHLGRSVEKIARGVVTIDDGTALHCDVVVAGIGVIPRTDLAEDTILQVDDGIMVDADYHALGADSIGLPNVLAIGDVARRPLGTGTARIEHWSMALRDGQIAADTLLGTEGAEYGAPFFWTAQHNMSLRYMGHATDPDRFEVDGDLKDDDATVKVWQNDRIAAVITVGRDPAGLQAELALEADDQEALANM